VINVLTAAALLGAAGAAAAAEPGRPPEREKAIVLYVTKSIGAKKHLGQAPLAFGLRLQQSSPIDFRRYNDLFDLRYAPGVRTTLSSSGALMYDSYESMSADSWKTPWPYIVGALLIGGGLCLAEELICEDDDDDDSEYTPPTPNTPSDR
jgi:hypothetical protein